MSAPARFAAIDIGTNSVLLAVAEQGPAGLKAVVERAEITRLGRGVDATGRLSGESLSRTLAVVEAYAAQARDLGASRIACVATSAARDAENGPAFLERLRALRLAPEIVSGEREARLGYLAARHEFAGGGPLALLDVGGGSTEIVFGRGERVSYWTSLPVGSVRLYERFVRSDPPAPGEREQARRAIAGALLPVPAAGAGTRLVGAAGTVTTLAALAAGLPAYDAGRVHGSALERVEVARWVERLWRLPVEERRRLPGLQPGRADVIPVGALIVDAVLGQLGLDRLTVSDRGVRWGLLYELAAGAAERS